MSSPSKDTELKAGHPPAAKAGGMRVASKHHHSSQPPAAATPEEKAEEEEFAEPIERDQSKLVVSGVVTKGNADFPPAAVKVAHEKPQPQHDKRPPGGGAKSAQMHIHQPRKQ
ncbi:death-associated protein 1 [Nematostella vectensis]|nr:death-associated protein 1 [Nematostella vectensis]